MAIATVVSITGQAWARDAQGNLRELRIGDTLQEGEVLVTSDGGSAQLDFDDGLAPTLVEAGEQVTLPSELGADSDLDASDFAALDADLEALLAALDDDTVDLLDILDATAAGAGGGAGADGGHSFVRLARVAEGTDSLTFDYGVGQAGTLLVEEENFFLPTIEDDVQIAPVIGEITFAIVPLAGQGQNPGEVSGEGGVVVEGSSFLIVANVSVPPSGSPLVITLSNGLQIVIAVGQTSGSVLVTTRVDDPYQQGAEQIEFTVAGTTGGGYDQLTVGGIPAVTVVDDSDVTTVTLSAPEQVTEGGQITVTASVDHAPQGSALVITLSNGQQITIAAGELSGSVTFDSRVDDVYLQGPDSLGLSITAATGGNFEALDTTSSVTVAVVDDSDITTVTLSAPEQVTEGGQITVTATVNNAPQGSDLVLTLSNGQLITIAAGELSGSVTFDSRADDVYLQGTQSLGLSITGATGGNYEALDTTSSVTVDVVDDSDVTTVTLSAPAEVTEGGQITVTASVDNAPQGSNLVITLSNGQLITIAAGELSGSVTFDSRADDVYLQGTQSLGLSITGATGGNYEALDTTSSVTVDVVDDSDVTTITLSAPAEVTEGGQITVTASVDNAPQGSNLVITLSNGQQITVAAGELSGSVTFDSRADDVYLQGTQSLGLSITGATGGNYEALDTTSSVTVDVVDDSDVTTVTLSAPAEVTEGGQITVTASVDNAPQGSNLVITLSNGQQITVAAGELSGSVTFAAPNVPNGGGQLELNIESAGGGNYEALDTNSEVEIELVGDSIPEITLDSDDNSVAEAGLPNGSAKDGSHTTSGSFTVATGYDTLASLTITDKNGIAIDVTTGITTVAGVHGILVVMQGMDGSYSWTYTLSGPTDGDETSDSFSLIATDNDGSVGTSHLSIAIVDDAPQAYDNDGGIVTEDAIDNVLSGNVLSNDSFGADGPQDGSASVAWNVSAEQLANIGQYGTLVLNPDGSWSFTLDNSLAKVQALNASDLLNFPLDYTITDADGDTASATLSLSIRGADDSAEIIVNAEGADSTVYEAGLTSAQDTRESDSGSFQVSATDGIATVTVGTSTFTLAQLQGFSESTPSAAITTAKGTLVLTGYNGSPTSGTVSYTYTLSGAQTHGAPGSATDTSLTDSVALSVSGVGGSAALGTLSLHIIDDVPTFENIMNAIVANESGATLTGLHDLSMGGDGPGAIVIADPVIAGLNGSIVYTTTPHADGSVTKLAKVNGIDFFTLTVKVDGTYDFTLHEARPSLVKTVDFGSVQGGKAVEQLTLGDVVFRAVDTNGNNKIDNGEMISPSSAGFGVGNNNVDVGEKFVVSFINNKVIENIDFAYKHQGSTDFRMSWISNTGEMGNVGPINQDGWISINPAQDFTSITFTVLQGSGKIDGVKYGELVLPGDTFVNFDIHGIDADGDMSATQTLSVKLLGAGSTSVAITGTAEDEVIVGTSANDTINGGAGNDILIGGAGNDTFIWNDGDAGSIAMPAEDVVTDFTLGNFNAGEQGADRLDLADLLQGEESGPIDSFIFAAQEGTSTVLYVNHDGEIAADGSNATQVIVLENVDMNGANSTDFLQGLLESGQLHIDQ